MAQQLSRHTLLRCLELALVCCIIGLHFHSAIYGQTANFISSATAGGYLVILIGLFAGYIMDTPVNRRVELFYSLVGCVFFIVSGALIIDAIKDFSISASYRDRGYAEGSLCIIEGMLLLVDSYLTFKGEH